MNRILVPGASIGIVDVAFSDMFESIEPDVNWEAVNERIRSAAWNMGIDYKDICQYLGIDPHSEKYWEKFKTLPKMKTAAAVASYMGLSLSWVLTGKGHAPEFVRNGRSASNQSIADTADSTVLQGNTAGTLIINQSNQRESDHKRELMRLFDSMTIKDQTKLLHYAYTISEKSNTSS